MINFPKFNIYLFISLLVFFFIFYFIQQKIEHYSALDIYYYQNNKQNPDVCGECAGICKNKKCNNNCDIGNLNINPKCENLKYMNKRQFEITSSTGNNIWFTAFNNNSNIFANKNTNSWILENIPGHDCVFYIIAKNKPEYYLQTNKVGDLSVSLFRGGNTQFWQFIPTAENGKFMIKSVYNCMFLNESLLPSLLQNSKQIRLQKINNHVNLGNEFYFSLNNPNIKHNNEPLCLNKPIDKQNNTGIENNDFDDKNLNNNNNNKIIDITKNIINEKYKNNDGKIIKILIEGNNGEAIFNDVYFNIKKIEDNIYQGNSYGNDNLVIKIIYLSKNRIRVITTDGENCLMESF